MNKDNKNLVDLIIRYIILLLAPLSNLYIFYLILTPLTLYSIFFILNLFFSVSLSGMIINIKELGLDVELISACIAGSAYYLLLILNLSLPSIKLKKRIYMILYSFSALFLINILRILVLIFLFRTNLFEITHQFVWYLLSTFFVVLIWFSEVKLFKIKDLPVLTDIKYLYKQTQIKKKDIHKSKRTK